MKLIDTNAWCGSWPFTPITTRSSTTTDHRPVGYQIIESLVSPFDSVFPIDPMPGNRSMFDHIRSLKAFRPLPVINPRTSAWKDHLKEVAANPSVVGIRLLPAYHGYRLNSATISKLVEQVNSKGLRLVITARLVDERQEHHGVSIKPVSVKQLDDFIKRHPRIHPLIQGLSIHELESLSKAGGLFSTDTSFAEWEDTLRVLKRHLPVSRIQFGSLSPLQVKQAQVDKVRLSSITVRQRELIGLGNAKKFFNI